MKKFFSSIIEYVKEEYKFLLVLLFFFFFSIFPVDYYIIVGGDISNVSSRITIKNSYSSKGSFNISYVSELEGRMATYLLSFVVPSWEREKVSDYKYASTESVEDIDFRGDMDLAVSNSNAIYYAYTAAHKEVKEISSKLYVEVVYRDQFQSPLQVGDEILSMNGNHYDTTLEYSTFLQTLKEGENVTIEILRKGKNKTLSCPLYREENGRLVLGVYLVLKKDYQTKPSINISFRKDESGPSAGLVTALEIYNQLTKKDITKGHKIAGTGTIEEDGSVGAIGGIEYKIMGAVAGGADYFIVPDGKNYKDAKKLVQKKKYKIQLIPVKTFEEALEKLGDL